MQRDVAKASTQVVIQLELLSHVLHSHGHLHGVLRLFTASGGTLHEFAIGSGYTQSLILHGYATNPSAPS